MYIKVIISCVYDIYLILFDLICIYFFVVNVPFEAFFFTHVEMSPTTVKITMGVFMSAGLPHPCLGLPLL